MKYLGIMAVSIFLFTALGLGIGYFCKHTLEPTDEDVALVILVVPIGIGAGIGLIVGAVASILTAVSDYKRRS